MGFVSNSNWIVIRNFRFLGFVPLLSWILVSYFVSIFFAYLRCIRFGYLFKINMHDFLFMLFFLQLVFISFLLSMFLFMMFSLFVFVKLFECFLLKLNFSPAVAIHRLQFTDNSDWGIALERVPKILKGKFLQILTFKNPHRFSM